MQKIYNLFVPAEYTFKNHFIPKIKNPVLESFEVDSSRQGIQRKGNNHLVVFLDFCLKAPPEKFLEVAESENFEFHFRASGDVDIFRKKFAGQEAVALYSLSYNPRMTVLAWKLLMDIADDGRILVENEDGTLMDGHACVEDLKQMLVTA